MKRLIFMYFVLALLFSTSPVLAHPSKSMVLDFSLQEHTLRVRIAHEVKKPLKHYIDKIVVELNGKEIIEQKFKSQISKEGQEAVYMIIDAKPGDKITVIAYCNVSGKKKQTVKIPREEAED